MSVSIKDVKKGAMVRLANGWQAQVEDNKVNSQTRLCTVYGYETEMGSVYSSDIVSVLVGTGWESVELTESQKKAKATRSAWGF